MTKEELTKENNYLSKVQFDLLNLTLLYSTSIVPNRPSIYTSDRYSKILSTNTIDEIFLIGKVFLLEPCNNYPR